MLLNISEGLTKSRTVEKSIATVLLALKETSHCFAHDAIILKSWFKIPSVSLISDDENANEVSSAIKRVILNRFSAISFTYIRKNKGPKTDPCGTPAKTYLGSETEDPTKTLCLLSER